MLGRTLSHYRVLGEIGRGGMGVVYRALDVKLNREVALKCLPQGLGVNRGQRLRFLREARAAASLEHPNIAVVHEVDEADGTIFLAMELLQGETLRDRLDESPLTLERALDLAIEIAEGVSCAHEKGIVHRDLKPSNIVLTEQGHAKITDFGLAKQLAPLTAVGSDVATPFRGDTSSGRLVGSPSYMSPEQARGESVDHRSDMFSFGVLLCEMLTGELPFRAPSVPEILHAILHCPAPVLEDGISPHGTRELQRILDKCLAKAPAERYGTMKDLLVDLRAVHRSESSSPFPVRTSLRGRMVHLAGWVVSAILVLVALVWLEQSDRAPAEVATIPRAVPLTSFEGSEQDPALSPDGNFVAFVWDEGGTGASQLHVQLIGSSDPLRLTTGERAVAQPVWSPDGREIAFVRKGEGILHEIVVVPALGGPERSLGATTAIFAGLDWSPDGTQLALVQRLSPETPESIYLLSLATGSQRALTHPPSTGEGDRSPVFSPDGKNVAFVRWREGAKSEIFVQSLDGGEPTLVLSHGGVVRDLDWFPNASSLLFSSYGEGAAALWRISLNGGEPTRLPFGESARDLTVARSKNRLVFSRSAQDVNLWRIGGPSSSQPPQKWIASTRDDWSPEYSPDGRRIAFTSDRSGEPQIWIWEETSGEFTRVPFDGGASVPRWSPDGQTLAFAGDVEGNSDVYVSSIVGGFTRRLTEEGSAEIPWSWSPDGRFVYYMSDRLGSYHVFKVPAEGGPSEQLSHHGGVCPRASADGRSVYYVDESLRTVWRAPLDGGEESVVLETEIYRASFNLWRERLVYLRRDESLRFSLESFDLPSGLVTPLAELGSGARIGKYGQISVSPDGRFVLYPQDDGAGSDLVLVDEFDAVSARE